MIGRERGRIVSGSFVCGGSFVFSSVQPRGDLVVWWWWKRTHTSSSSTALYFVTL